MKGMQSTNLPHRASVTIAILAVAAATLIVAVTLIQSQRTSAQVPPPPMPVVVDDSSFTDGNDTLIIQTGETRIISGAVDFGMGTNRIINRGTLIIRSGSTISGLAAVNGFVQTATTAILTFDIDLDTEPASDIVDFSPAANNSTFTITSGNIHLNYLGDWEPIPFQVFTLFTGFDLLGDVRLGFLFPTPSSDTARNFTLTHSAYGNLTDSDVGGSFATRMKVLVPEGAIIGGPNATFTPVFTDDFDEILIPFNGSLHITDNLDLLGDENYITSLGTLTIDEGVTIEGLAEFDGFSQFGGSLMFNLTRDEPLTSAVVNLPGAGVTLDGSVYLNYEGGWAPSLFGEEFTLISGLDPFADSILPAPQNVSHSQDSTKIALRVSGDGTSIIAVVTPSFVESSEFTNGDDTLTIRANETRMISGAVDFGMGTDQIINEGTLIIRSGSTISGLAAIDGFIQTSATATLIFDIDLDTEPTSDIAVFDRPNATNDTFNITSGNVHLRYSGGWVPRPLPTRIVTLFNDFYLFADIEQNFALTDSAYGTIARLLPGPDGDAGAFPTQIVVLLPRGVVVGGPNPTFTPIFTNDYDELYIPPSGSLRIAGDLDLLGDTNHISNFGTLTIDEGVTITGLSADEDEGLAQSGESAELIFNLTRDEPLTAAAVTLPDAHVNIEAGLLRINYNGGWQPSLFGEEFTLINTLATSAAHTLPLPQDVSHSQDSTDIALRVSRDGTSIIAVVTPPVIDDTEFMLDDTIIIEAGETRIVSGAVDFGDGNDSVINAGILMVKPGSPIDNLELLKQTSAGATLRIEIAEDPGSNPVLDLGAAGITISGGKIQLSYTGSWRPNPGETFILFATSGNVTVSSSVRITDIGDGASSDYTGTQSGTAPTNFNVQANQPRYTPDDVVDDADFGAGNDTFIIQTGETRVIDGDVNFGTGTNQIINRGTLIIKSGSTISGLAATGGFIQNSAAATLIFDIDLDGVPRPDIVNFVSPNANNNTFNITSGNIHLRYLGDWEPAPFQTFVLFNGFDLLRNVILPFNSLFPGFDPLRNFTLTHSAYGNLADFDYVNADETKIQVLVPEDAILGGLDRTFTPIFTDGYDDIFIPPSGSLQVTGDLGLLGGPNIIENVGILTINEGVTIAGLGDDTLFFQRQSTEAELIFNLTRDAPLTTAAVSLPRVGVGILNGSVHVNYKGAWEPSPFGEEFTLIGGLYPSADNILPVPQNISHSQDFNDIDLRVSRDKTSIIAVVTPSILESSDFTDGDDTLTIRAGETRTISGAVDFGMGTDQIINGGTLIIKSGSTISGLAAVDGFIQTSAAATLIFDINLDTEPTSDIVVFDRPNATNDTFTITNGNIHLRYSGGWVPQPLPTRTVTLFNGFHLFADIEQNFTLTHSAYGTIDRAVPGPDDDANAFPTRILVLIPDGEVIGGPNATFTPIFTNDDNLFLIPRGRSLRITGDLDLIGGGIVSNEGALTIDEGVTITGLSADEDEGLAQFGEFPELILNLTRDEPLTAAAVTLPGARVNIEAGSLHINYNGGWTPSPLGEEFTLIDGLDPSVDNILPDPENVSHSKGSTDIALRVSDSGASIIAVVTPSVVESSDFTDGDDTLTIRADEVCIISGAMDFGMGTDQIINEGTLIIKSGATISGLAAVDGLIQTSAVATLIFDINLDTEPTSDIVVFDRPNATNDTFNITNGNIHLRYSGGWVPQPLPTRTVTLFNSFHLFADIEQNFTLTHSAYGTIDRAVPGPDDDANAFPTQILVLIPDGEVIGGPNATFVPIFTNDDNLFLIPRGRSLRISGNLDLIGGGIISNEGALTIDEGVTITGLSADEDEGLDQFGESPELILNLTRDEPLTAAAVTLPGARVNIEAGSLHINYNGGWTPSPLGDEFTLIDGLDPSVDNILPLPQDVSHSQDSTDIALRVSDSGTSVVAVVTRVVVPIIPTPPPTSGGGGSGGGSSGGGSSGGGSSGDAPDDEPVNRAPRTSGSISDRTVNEGQIIIIDVTEFFIDTDDLDYSVRSNNTNVATVDLGSGGTLIVTAVGTRAEPAIVSIIITAEDTAGQTVRQVFEIVVAPSFMVVFLPDETDDRISRFQTEPIPESSPDAPPPPANVRLVYPIYEITPIDLDNDPLPDTAATVCLPLGDYPQPTKLAVYHYNDGDEVWERLPSYINEANTHACGETESFSIFALGLTGLLPPTGGIIPSIWIIAAAATAGIMTLFAGAAYVLATTLPRSRTTCYT